jgi:hypothetical protein
VFLGRFLGLVQELLKDRGDICEPGMISEIMLSYWGIVRPDIKL